jgi:glycosyltransferase involved in cell wall biosynthesis
VLEKRLECMHPNTQVRLIGHCDHPSDLMFSADGVIISSRREGFSYVFNEALMCGANILSTDVPVANEVLPSELIVAVDDAAKLREKLIMLLNTPEAWAALMQGAHQFARQNMTITQMTEKTINLYQRIQ